MEYIATLMEYSAPMRLRCMTTLLCFPVISARFVTGPLGIFACNGTHCKLSAVYIQRGLSYKGNLISFISTDRFIS